MQPTFTELWEKGRAGDRHALDRAWRLILEPLRRAAAALVNRERYCLTLQPTVLVNEVYLRLHRFRGPVSGRCHFLGLSTLIMKQLLIDRSRGRAVRRRYQGNACAALSQPVIPSQFDNHVAARQVWEKLSKLDSGAAEAIWLWKVEGLTRNEIAARQGRPAWQVVDDCDFAIAWMSDQLTGP